MSFSADRACDASCVRFLLNYSSYQTQYWGKCGEKDSVDIYRLFPALKCCVELN